MHKVLARRIMAWVLSICMIAGAVDLTGFTVHAATINLDGATITLEQTDYTYTGAAIEPVVTEVRDASGDLISADLYNVTYGNNINAGDRSYVRVAAKDDPNNFEEVSFNINPKSLQTNWITPIADQTTVQDGVPITPKVTVKDPDRNDKELQGQLSQTPVPGMDFTYVFSNNTQGGTATVTITGQGNYSGTISAAFTIIKLDNDKLEFSYTPSAPTYQSREEVKPVPNNVKYDWGGSQGKVDLVLEQDYTVEYENNRFATREAIVRVVGKGRYQGLAKEMTFVIQKNVDARRYGDYHIIVADIPDQPLAFTGDQGVLIDAEDVYVYDPDYPADEPGKPGRRLRPNIDYEVIDFKNNKAETTKDNPATFVVHGLSGVANSQSAYTGNQTVEFQIVAAQLSDKMVTIKDTDCVYDGTDQSKNVEVTVKNGDITYTKDVDYTVQAVGNSIDAGTRQLLISAKPGGQLKGGPVTVTYTIKQRDLSEASITLTGPQQYTYDGSAKTPSIEVTYNGQPLVPNRDFDAKYDNNTNVSTDTVKATVYAVGKGNFKGNSATRPFDILPFELTDQNMIIDNFSEEYTYTGRDITPAVRISVEGLGILVSGTDYTITCPNNRNVGDVTMQIVGIGNYSGGTTKNFKIVPRNVEDGVTINVPSTVEYTGQPVEPKVTLNYNGELESPNDYTLKFSNNTNVGEATVEITGHNNFTGTMTRTFRINGRNINSGELVVLDTSKNYNFTSPDVTADQRFYKYTGDPIEPVLTVSYANASIGMGERSLVEGEDYEISYNNQTELGTAQVILEAKGNYSGTKTLLYTIKGDLSDHNNPDGFTKITIPTQIYSPVPVVPENVEISFNGTALKKDVDYEITCENNDIVTDKARAAIQGKGKYCGLVDNLEFTIRPMNLTTDDLTENNYVIDNIAQSYVYWGEPIRPVPEITHQGETLEADTDYRLDYGGDGDNVKAGKGKVTVHGATPNYEGSHDVEFDIEKYDIGADYAKDCIKVTGLVKEVMLDDVKEGLLEGEGAAMSESNPDAVIQTKFKVMYTPVNPVDKTEKGEPRELLPSEYSVSYEGNTTIGEVTMTFTGIGDNFTGTITETFKIMGDLSKDSTSLTVEDCVYSPAANGVSTNTPEPVVKYTITRFNGTKQVLTLEKDKDYKVRYEHNDNATVVEGQNAKVIISPITDADDNVTGNYKGTKEAEFVIEQRDLSKAVASGSVEKDPDLEVTGVAEEGYEYTGSQIVPDLQVKCKGTALSKIMAGTEDPEDFDFELSAANNLNVYTYEIGPTGSRERKFPTLTVEARHNEDGDYTGNYKGKFQMKFQINPRQISKETIDTVEQVVGIEPEMDYTGNPITFRKPSDDPTDIQNNIIVTWCKTTSAGQVKQLLTENTDYEIIYEDNTKIGEATVRISAVRDSNYEGAYDKHFKIMANLEVLDETDPTVKQYMSLDYNHNVPYGMAAVYPELELKDYSGVMCQEATEPKVLEKGVDYEIVEAECKNNVDVGQEDAENVAERPTVVIQGIGCYRGKITRYYNITPMDLSDDQGYVTAKFIGSLNSEDYENAYLYTGEPVQPQIEVYNRDQVMVPKVNYIIKDYINNTEISTEEKKAGVIIQAVEGGNYLNEKTLYFNIIPNPIEGMQVKITSGPQIFDRTEKKPEVEISYRNGTQTVTLDPKNYDVAYENNINVASKTDENPPTIIITGKGGYGGTIRETFAIEPESLAAPAEGETDDFVIKAANAIYTGEAVTTTLEVKAKDGTLLVEDQDYTMGDYHNNIEAGEAAVEIHGMGNYTGTRQVSFYITPADAEIKVSEIPEQEYTSKEIRPEITVTLGDTEIVLTEGQDYEAEYSNNVNAGTAKVSVKGSGNFSGTAEAEFIIKPKSIGTEEDGIAQDMVLEELEDQLYTGGGVTPDISLAFRRGITATVEDGEITETEGIDETLALNRDYRLTYLDNVAVGTASVSITGIGNYTGTLQSQFKILGPMNLADVPPIPVQPYTGEPATPEPDVSFAGIKLVKDTDYTLEYKDNVNRGTATIIITGMGWYTGTKEVTFDIAREFSEETLIKGVASAYTYTGKAIAPVIRVEDKGMLLTNGKDYEVSYSDNINAGTATITITGMDRYRGTKTTTFKIMPQNIGRAEVEKVANQTYDKTAKKPNPKVSSDGKTLKEGTDYTIVHRGNKGPGMASVVVKGKGNYTGSQTVNYKIIIPKVTGVKKTKYTDTTITFAWKRNSVVTGYEIYNSKNKRVAFIRTNKTVKATVSKLKAGSVDTYRVRAYVKKGGVYYYGAFVKLKAGTAPKATKVTSIASKKSKQVTLKWKKISGATSYEVYRSDSKKGKYKKLTSTKKTTYTDKKASGGKTYYYKLRVSKKSGAGTYTSGYSSVVSIRAKK